MITRAHSPIGVQEAFIPSRKPDASPIANGVAAPRLLSGPVAAGVAYYLAFWLVAALLGFPRTYWDDSLIVGPAVSLAETGKLVNIFVTKRFFPGDVYLFYPPLYFWTLAGWMTVFGRGMVSLALFWGACCTVTSIAVALLLARRSQARTAAWLVAPVLVFGCVAYTGYRYENLGFATLFAGLVLGLWGFRPAGYVLLFMTPAIAPTFLGASVVSLAVVLWMSGVLRSRGQLVRELLVAGGSFLLVVGLLTISVAGRIDGLMATMYQYRSVRVGLGGRDVGMLGLPAKISVFLSMATLLIEFLVLRRPVRSPAIAQSALIMLMWELTVASHARPAIMVALNIAALILFALSLSDVVAKFAKVPPVASAVAALSGVAFLLATLNFFYTRDVAIRPLSPELVQRARASVSSAPPGELLVVDPRIAKEALAYQTNRPMEDSMIRHAWPGFKQDFRKIPAGEYWVMSRNALALTLFTELETSKLREKWALFIALGMPVTPGDGICILSDKRQRRQHGDDRAELLVRVCEPQA